MLKRTRLWFSGLMSCFLLSACSSITIMEDESELVTISDVTSFQTIASQIQSLNAVYGAENVLIVSDIDNTLLTSTSDLGGDIWYQWQRHKLDIKPTEDQQVPCLFEDAIGLLYELNPMVLTEIQVPEEIEQWQRQGNTVVALTSRSPKYRTATERELFNKNIDMSKSLLAADGQQEPVFRETLERELSYSNGIMMTTGMDKGKMLHWLLQKTNRSFEAIVFIDDSYKNIENMFNAWQNSAVDMHIFYYTRVEEDRIKENGAVLTQSQADKMAADYRILMQTLRQIFPSRPTNHCMSVN